MDRAPYRASLVVIVGVLGFLVALAFNSTRGFVDARPERATDLIDVVRDLEGQRTDLQDRLSELRDRMRAIEAGAAEDAGVRDSFTRELEGIRATAGLTAVVGPGVEVVLGDAAEVASGGDPNDYLIHDTDVSAVVNALFAGGAEAVDVNGERIVATTPIRCAGTTILVNSVRLGGPYTVRAVGDPVGLEEALAEDPSASLLLGTYRSQYGLAVTVARSTEVRVAPYRGSMRPESLVTTDGGRS